jgi:hypothetical protein
MKQKRPLTPEQQARSDEKRAAMRNLCKKIAAMTDEDRTALAQSIPAIFTCEQRMLSDFNQCLLASQRPDATIVGGFRQWLKQGRVVRKGEHGSYIWVPLGAKEETADGSSSTVMHPDDRRFLMVAVFDIAQTEERQR